MKISQAIIISLLISFNPYSEKIKKETMDNKSTVQSTRSKIIKNTEYILFGKKVTQDEFNDYKSTLDIDKSVIGMDIIMRNGGFTAYLTVDANGNKLLYKEGMVDNIPILEIQRLK